MNNKTVWVVYPDPRKNFEAARKFGDLRPVFAKMHGSIYETPGILLEQARENLREFQPGDYLLMVGDTTLCAIATLVVAEMVNFREVNFLRWNRLNVDYMPMNLILDDYENRGNT